MTDERREFVEFHKTNIICNTDNIESFSWLFAFHFSVVWVGLKMTYLLGDSNQIKIGGITVPI